MMTREEMLEAIVKNIRLNIEGLENGDIDPMRSLAELGATSLDIVEIVSASMRELNIRVPRTELAGLRNINELVDLFVLVKQRELSEAAAVS